MSMSICLCVCVNNKFGYSKLLNNVLSVISIILQTVFILSLRWCAGLEHLSVNVQRRLSQSGASAWRGGEARHLLRGVVLDVL